MYAKREDLTNQTIGTIHFGSPAPSKANKSYWNCSCIICSQKRVLQTYHVKHGHTKSCGCGHYDPNAPKIILNLNENNKNNEKICPICKQIFIPEENGLQRKYCFECSPKNNSSHSYDAIEKKKLCVSYKGGKCIICGYNNSFSALHFHHINPKDKSYSISKCYYKDFEELKKELDKCILLCANCHAEVHEKMNKNSDFDIMSLIPKT